jgi:hypothetical protein
MECWNIGNMGLGKLQNSFHPEAKMLMDNILSYANPLFRLFTIPLFHEQGDASCSN